MEPLILSDIANPKKTKETLNAIIQNQNQLQNEHNLALEEVNEKLLIIGELQDQLKDSVEQLVPKRLTLLPDIPETVDGTQASLYVDYAGESYKTPLSEVGTQVKTVGNYEYANVRVGGYIFLEKGE